MPFDPTDALFALLVLLMLLFGVTAYSHGHPGALSPEKTTYVEGIENFETAQSSMDLNQLLMPDKDFPDRFPTRNTEYYYKDEFNQFSVSDYRTRSIVICEYDADVYDEAKAYCLREMELSDEHRQEYKGYEFILNTGILWSSRYPEWINHFVYNDDQHRLIFLGFEETDDHEGYTENVQLARDDFGAFLEKNFGEFYDFSE